MQNNKDVQTRVRVCACVCACVRLELAESRASAPVRQTITGGIQGMIKGGMKGGTKGGIEGGIEGEGLVTPVFGGARPSSRFRPPPLSHPLKAILRSGHLFL
jgi:hypothetical protein